ncbi:amino acid adenylation domain-containing protein [Streptomyces sp. NPDC091265]|uniref:amino acid adenylation domain-containing protein n=1 Tax=unclassified Streptomyces TaxID=2593676 RepID=UPI00344FA795
MFQERAARHPERIAVIHRERSVAFGTLDQMSTAIAARLRDAGVAPGQVVGVCVARSPELIAGLLAVLTCGAAYLPFSAQWPDGRLRDLFGRADCSVVLTDRSASTAARLPGFRVVAVGEEGDAAGVARATGSDGASEPDGVPAVGDARAAPVRRTPVPPEAIAYINFTSGSNGQPKGVLVEHRAVLRLVSGAVYAALDESCRLLHMAPVTFDAATFEIWGALLHGGTCVLFPSDLPRLSELKRVLVDHAVNTVFLTTALFNSIMDDAPHTLDTVDRILTGGEAHSLTHMGTALSRFGPGRVTHVYGPTESTTFATYHPVRTLPPAGRPLPIGVPIQNTRAYVVDGDRLCAAGESGELLLAGPGLSPGYLGMAERTAESFVLRDVAGTIERLYRTGDLVHIDGEGMLVFGGRRDDQVKVNGFRIEPGEVAHHLDRHPEVRQSFVMAHRSAGGATSLLAFVVPATDRCTAAVLQDYLRGALPSYLIPAGIHLCEALPLSPTGKVDRQALVARTSRSKERP